MVCPRCGIDVSEQQKFCHDCGAQIPLPEPAGDPTEPVDTLQPPTEPIEVVQPPT